MTAWVELSPSGRRFPVEKGETILEAALRSGLSLNYSCNNGSCGECRARVLSGDPGEILPHDYVLRESEKSQGVILLCSTRAASDLVIEATEAGIQDIPRQHITATVYRIEQPIDNVRVLYLRTPRSSTLRFLAGQHATISPPDVPPRNKSIASCPCNGMFLQFHIRQAPDDPFARFVFAELKNRQKIEVDGPFGGFTLDEASSRPLIFLAYETGFAPIKSLIEHAIALELGQPMHLYWTVNRIGDHYMANQCRAWRDALDDFQFHPLHAQDLAPVESPGVPVAQRDFAATAARVVAEHRDLSGFDVYASGPEPAFTLARERLLAHGLPADRLFIDVLERR